MSDPFAGQIVTWNLRGVASPSSFDSLLSGIVAYNSLLQKSNSKLTALCVQEHNLGWSSADKIYERTRRSRVLWVAAHSHRNVKRGSGTGIAIPYDSIERRKDESLPAAVERVRSSAKRALTGGFCSVKTLVAGHERHIASVYAPVHGRLRAAFFNRLRQHLTATSHVGADWNCVPDESLDVITAAASGYSNTGADELSQLMAAKSLVDVAREQLGSDKEFTHYQRVTTASGSSITYTRLDRWYIPQGTDLMWTHKLAHELWGSKSDHKPVALVVSSPAGQRGRDLESVDDRILDDARVLQRLEAKIKNMQIHYPTNRHSHGEQWELIKKALRRICIQETKALRKRRSVLVEMHEHFIAAAERQLSKGTLKPDGLDRLDSARKRLAALKGKKLPDASTAYDKYSREEAGLAPFYRTGKNHSNDRHINELSTADWSDVSNPTFSGSEKDPSKVATAATAFFEALFAAKPSDEAATRECLNTLRSGSRIHPETARACGADITAREITSICSKLPTGKSPGPDRLPNALYKRFSSLLGPILADVFNEARRGGSLPGTMKEGTISLLYKKKCRKDIRNYRPITLLNGDYKIFTRALTLRVNNAVTEFVSTNQAGFVPGAFIGEVTMALQLVQEYMDESNEDAMLIFLDMEKAFDRVSWPFLRRCVEAAGMDDTFLSYLDLMYSEGAPPARKILANGFLGPSFPISSGVAQGCPLSPLLFLFITEPLIRLIAKCPDIKGVSIGQAHIKSLHFADDTSLAARPADIPHYNKCLNTWCKASSMKENMSKREGLLLGRLAREPSRAPSGVIKDDAWCPDGDHVVCLGVPLGRFSRPDWWKAKARSTKEILSRWRTIAHRSPAGRNMLGQGFYLGRYRYWLLSLMLDSSASSAIQSDYEHLMWARDPMLDPDSEGTPRTHRAYVKRAAAGQSRRQGGAGVMNFAAHATAYRITWIRRYLEPRQTPWQLILDHYLGTNSAYRGIVLSRPGSTPLYRKIPSSHPYLRACLRDFLALGLQPTSIAEVHVKKRAAVARERLAGPIFSNHDFQHPRWRPATISVWKNVMETLHISELFDAGTGNHFWLDTDWYNFANQLHQKHKGRVPSHEWCAQKVSEAAVLSNAVPQYLVDAAQANHPITEGTFVALIANPSGSIRWARLVGDRYFLFHLDCNGVPHPSTDTNTTVTPSSTELIVPASMWAGKVRGTIQNTYPPDEGWTLPSSPLAQPITRLSDLAIHTVTSHLSLARTARPSCEAAWNSRLNIDAPWADIWKSFGTFITNPTDEKTAHKLAHRGLYTRSRDSQTNQLCRLGCGCRESQQHLAECRHCKPFWDSIFSVASNQLGAPQPHSRTHAVILGLWTSGFKLAPPPVLALLRIAVRMLYACLTSSSEDNTHFVWQQPYVMTVRSLRTRCLAVGERLRRTWTARARTPNPFHLPVRVCDAWANLILIDNGGECTTLADGIDPLVNDAISQHKERLKDMARRAARRNAQRAARFARARAPPAPAPAPAPARPAPAQLPQPAPARPPTGPLRQTTLTAFTNTGNTLDT